jgi:hypothetical protein
LSLALKASFAANFSSSLMFMARLHTTALANYVGFRPHSLLNW